MATKRQHKGDLFGGRGVLYLDCGGDGYTNLQTC